MKRDRVIFESCLCAVFPVVAKHLEKLKTGKLMKIMNQRQYITSFEACFNIVNESSELVCFFWVVLQS